MDVSPAGCRVLQGVAQLSLLCLSAGSRVQSCYLPVVEHCGCGAGCSQGCLEWESCAELLLCG